MADKVTISVKRLREIIREQLGSSFQPNNEMQGVVGKMDPAAKDELLMKMLAGKTPEEVLSLMGGMQNG